MSLTRDPETGHLVGIEQAPEAASKPGIEFPKWVTPDPSHVVAGERGVSVAGFEHHVDRAGNVTVLVKDAAEEADALAPKSDKTRLWLVPDAPEDAADGAPLSPLWPKPAEQPVAAAVGAAAGESTADASPAAAAGAAAQPPDLPPDLDDEFLY